MRPCLLPLVPAFSIIFSNHCWLCFFFLRQTQAPPPSPLPPQPPIPSSPHAFPSPPHPFPSLPTTHPPPSVSTPARKKHQLVLRENGRTCAFLKFFLYAAPSCLCSYTVPWFGFHVVPLAGRMSVQRGRRANTRAQNLTPITMTKGAELGADRFSLHLE